MLPSGEHVFIVLGDADNEFRVTSVERERNYTSSKQSDEKSMVISFDERRAGAKPWWGRMEPPFVPIQLFLRNITRNSLPTPKLHLAHSDPEATYTC